MRLALPRITGCAVHPADRESFYVARISLTKMRMAVDGGRLVKLTAGMSVTVEMEIGSHRILSCLLSPVTRYRHDSRREQ
jgi:hemolysin D